MDARAKIEKLLALAARPGTPAEGAAALKAARSLADQHGLRIVRRGGIYKLRTDVAGSVLVGSPGMRVRYSYPR